MLKIVLLCFILFKIEVGASKDYLVASFYLALESNLDHISINKEAFNKKISMAPDNFFECITDPSARFILIKKFN